MRAATCWSTSNLSRGLGEGAGPAARQHPSPSPRRRVEQQRHEPAGLWEQRGLPKEHRIGPEVRSRVARSWLASAGRDQGASRAVVFQGFEAAGLTTLLRPMPIDQTAANTCPDCGAWKRSEFDRCFDCGTDECPECGRPKIRENAVCRNCADTAGDSLAESEPPGALAGCVATVFTVALLITAAAWMLSC